MGKGRKPVVLCKGQAKISSFFIKQNEQQNRQILHVLSDKSNANLPLEVQTLPYFEKDAVKSLANDSPPEVILSEDESLASPKKEVKVVDENCDVIFITSKPTSAVKRKLCSEDDIPDIIPVTPTSKTRNFSLSCKRTKHSKMEKCSSSKGRKEGFSLIDSLNKAFNTDATENRVLSVNNPEHLNNSPYKKMKLNGVESVHTKESKASDCKVDKVLGQVQICTEKCDYNNTSNIKSCTNDFMNTQDCTKPDNLLEGVRNHDEVTSLGFEHDNFHSTEQKMKDVCSTGCDAESCSFGQLTDTNGNVSLSPIPETTAVILSGDTDVPDVFLENSISHNPVASKNKVSDCNVPKYDSEQPNDTVCTCSIPERSERETKQRSDGIADSVRFNKTSSSDVSELNRDCGSVGSSNKVFGYDILNSECKAAEVERTCTVLPEENVLRQPITKSDSVNLEGKGSENSVQRGDQHADVLCCRLQTAATTSAVEQLKTGSKTGSPDDIAHEDHTAWLSSDNWDFSMIEERGTGFLEDRGELSLEAFQRCEIVELMSEKKWEKIVKLRSTRSQAMTSCLLQDFWADSDLEVGDIVSIRAGRSETCCPASWFVNNSVGLLVLHPDTLISSTAVVGSLFCPRRGVLSEWFRGIDSDSRIMIIGSLVHELLQKVLERNIRTLSEIREVIQELLNKSACIQMLYSAHMSKEEGLKELEYFIPRIANFMDMYVQDSGHMMAPTRQLHNERNNVEKCNGTICAVHDIEENIWVPELGLKGKVDVTVEVKINRLKKGLTKVMPLELKTGRSSFSAEHKGQVTLYARMMSQRGRKVDSGMLLYLRDGIMQEVKAGNNEWRDLVLLRNQLAHFITRSPTVMDSGTGFKPPLLPEPINHPSACSKCPYLTICTSFLGRDGLSSLSTSNPLVEFASTATSHLSASHVDYLIHWTGLLLLESQTPDSIRQKDLWCLTPQQREKRGKSFSSMVLTGRVIISGDSYVHTLQKECVSFPDLRTSGLAVGEYVTVSTDDWLAVATGTVCDITQRILTLSLNRDLAKYTSRSCFHIDIYTLQNAKVFNLTNLGCLMDNKDVATKLRRLIIDKERPTYVEGLQSSILRPGRSILKPLNVCQRRAVLKALTANDYFLIKGMPGTGKTSTIVSLVELLVKLGQSVLVTSHTHSAVDNVLLKLAERNVDLLRLGSSSRFHPKLRDKSEGDLAANCVSPAQMEALYNSKPVVGTTCLGAGHPLFARRTFDVCIVDESTQVLQVSVLRPLFSAKKFVLVGDPDQLPPLVRNTTAREMGMTESLFARLDSPDATVCLDVQYRMNQAITDVANGITYNGQLKCADEQVSNATLQLPALHMVAEELESETWLRPVLSTAMIHSVLVIDTGPIAKKLTDDSTSTYAGLIHGLLNGSNERSQKSDIENNDALNCNELSKVIKEISDEERSCTNLYEAVLVQHIVAVMTKGGAVGSSIGVIAPFRAQVALLRKMIANTTGKDVEVNTVDQYQGRDKDIIIFSCTKTDYATKKSRAPNNKENEILEDKRRLTVAITRAKHKLLVIGDVKTLHRYQPFQRLFDCLPSEQMIVLSDGSNNFEWNRLMVNVRKSIDGICQL